MLSAKCQVTAEASVQSENIYARKHWTRSSDRWSRSRRAVCRSHHAAHLRGASHRERRLHRSLADQCHRRGAAAFRRRPRPLRCHGSHRRHGARDESHRPGRTHLCARGPRHAWACDERDRRTGRPTRSHRTHADDANPPPGPAVRRTGNDGRDVRNRREGHRPHSAIFKRRKNRIVRRRGGGQDRRHHGTHQQRRQAARRILRVRRSR